MGFLDFAMKRTTRASLVPFLVYDVMAVLPRWAADAYANAWRGFAVNCDCDVQHAWLDEPMACLAHDGMDDVCQQHGHVGDLSPHSCGTGCQGGDLLNFLTSIGVGGVDLHRYWARTDVTQEPQLRRAAGCTFFA